MKTNNRNVVWFASFFLLFLVQVLWAGGSEQGKQFREAIEAYASGDYKAATRQFEALAQDGLSASLLYNLANSYAQAGESGRAILNYERARRLAPGDSDIKGNLQFLRKEKGLFQEEQSLSRRIICGLELNQWTALALISFICFAALLLLPLPSGLQRTPRYAAAVVCLLLTTGAIAGGVGQYRHWNDGVVIAADARLRVSPFSSAASTGTIQEGRLVRPEKSHGNYFLVKDETGRRGWLEAAAFESIVPMKE